MFEGDDHVMLSRSPTVTVPNSSTCSSTSLEMNMNNQLMEYS